MFHYIRVDKPLKRSSHNAVLEVIKLEFPENKGLEPEMKLKEISGMRNI